MPAENEFKTVALQIVKFINDPSRLAREEKRTRFIVCGTSGAGKSRSIEEANELLPISEQIAESQELLHVRDPAQANAMVRDPDLEYEESLHIAFNVFNRQIAEALEAKGVKVFWLDKGTTARI